MRCLFLLPLCLLFSDLFAQYSSSYQTNINFQTSPRGFVSSLAPAPANKIESYYLYETWNRGTIFLKDSTKLDDIDIKVDYKVDVIEIQYKNEVKVLPFAQILGISLFNQGDEEIYVNGTSLLGKNTIFNDELLQLIDGGEVKLFCKIQPKYIKAPSSQNPMLSSGTSEDKVVIQKVYHLIYQNQLVTIDGSKSKFKSDVIAIFGNEAEAIIKNKNYKKEEDLISLAKELSKLKMKAS